MRKYSFTDEQIDAIYEFVYIAQDVSESREEKDFLQSILKIIDVQSDYTRPEVQEYAIHIPNTCLLYTSPSPRDLSTSRMPSSA